MNKFKAAYQNELIKMLRKKSVYILTAIMVALTVIMVLFFRLIASLANAPQYRTDYDSVISSLQSIIKTEFEYIDNNSDLSEEEIYNSILTISYSEGRIFDLNYERENPDTPFDEQYYLFDAKLRYGSCYDLLRQYDLCKQYSIRFEEIEAKKIDELRQEYELYKSVIENKDFDKYIDAKIAESGEDDPLSKEYKALYEFRKENRLTGETQMQIDAINQYWSIGIIERSLKDGYNYSDGTGDVLLPSEVEALKNQLAVLNCKYESGYFTNDEYVAILGLSTQDILMTALSTGMTLVLILLVILAGSTVSGEVSSGAIKAVIVQPVKRWKIFTAKGLMLVTVGAFECLLLWIVSVLSTGLFFGFDHFAPYIYAVNGVANMLPFVGYAGLLTLIYFIRVVFLASLAFMISSCSKSTALSIALPLGLNFVVDGIVSVITLLGASWAKYFPTACISLFESSLLPSMSAGEVLSELTSLLGISQMGISMTFAVIYVSVLVFAMILTGRESFCKRDIK